MPRVAPISERLNGCSAPARAVPGVARCVQAVLPLGPSGPGRPHAPVEGTERRMSTPGAGQSPGPVSLTRTSPRTAVRPPVQRAGGAAAAPARPRPGRAPARRAAHAAPPVAARRGRPQLCAAAAARPDRHPAGRAGPAHRAAGAGGGAARRDPHRRALLAPGLRPPRHAVRAAQRGVPASWPPRWTPRSSSPTWPPVRTRSCTPRPGRLIRYEQQVSRRRQELQRTADDCSAEIARRYRDGEAQVDDLLI